ncbi:MAG: hypothetical protein QXU52_00725 [Fervidicoccaceae archaeon]
MGLEEEVSSRLEVRRLRDPSEYRKIVDVMMEVWGMKDSRAVVAHHLLIAADRRGGLVLGAFDRDTGELLGFCFGIPALTGNGKLYHYSHMTGVVPRCRYKGVGYALKLEQRRLVLEQGLDLIAWTYDPLQAPNAKFNIAKLGAVVRKFYVNYYGELIDSINYGMPTDRFEAEWWIKSKRVELRLSRSQRPPDLERILQMGAEVVTRTREVGGLRLLESFEKRASAETVLVEIPRAIEPLRGAGDALSAWRLGLRELFEEYINGSNYVVVDFVCHEESGRCFYVLWRRDLEKILEEGEPWR